MSAPTPTHVAVPGNGRVPGLPERIEQALVAADRILRSIAPDHLDRPTPCPEWDVRALLAHLVGGVAEMATMIGGPANDGEAGSDPLVDDPLASWDAAVDADRAAWARPDALDGTVTFPFGAVPAPLAAMIHLTELTVHAIDVAAAIDRLDLVDDASAATLLRSMHELGGIDAFRVPGMFGAAVDVPADAPAHRRLLAYVGRNV